LSPEGAAAKHDGGRAASVRRAPANKPEAAPAVAIARVPLLPSTPAGARMLTTNMSSATPTTKSLTVNSASATQVAKSLRISDSAR
jgi:hypothetical protein